MRKQELYDRVIAYFKQAIPVAETELHYENPFQLLIAVILSAQCTCLLYTSDAADEL